MKMKKGILSLAVMVALLAMLLAPLSVAAEGPQPVFPTVFYGKITVKGAPAPEGTVITGMMEQEVDGEAQKVARGDITVTEPGKYGKSRGMDVLIINTSNPDDLVSQATIWFYVQLPNWKTAVPANETAKFDSIDHELNLTVTGDGGIIDDGGSSGGGGGGGGGGGRTKTEASSSNILVTADVFGTEVRFYLTPAGAVVNTVTLNTPDGQMSLTLPEGTLARDSGGQPITSLVWSAADNPPQPPDGTALIGSAFNLENAGTAFSPPVAFTYNYDPADLPSGIDEADLALAFYDTEAKAWVKLSGTVDTAARTLTVPISHFTTFAVTGLLPVSPEPTPEETPPAETAPVESGNIAETTPTPPPVEEQPAEVTSPFNWALIGGIIGAVVVIAFLAVFITGRRRAA